MHNEASPHMSSEYQSEVSYVKDFELRCSFICCYSTLESTNFRCEGALSSLHQ